MGYVEIPGIDRTLDTFTFADHGLNCFLVPKYLATSAFGVNNREFFYAFFYLYQHYDLDNIQPYFPPPVSATEQHVLRDSLGLALSTCDITERFYEQITQALDQGSVVFVPVDRGAYFYNKNFGLEHHPHVLLLKGYNPGNRLIMIMDCEHNDKLLNSGLSEPLLKQIGSIYSEFYIPFDMLVQLNRSYDDHFQKLRQQLQIMHRAEAPAISSNAQALTAIDQLLQPHLDNVQGMIERKFQCLERSASGSSDARRVVAYLNTQMVLIQTLPKLFAQDSRGSHLVSRGQSVVATWKQFRTSLSLAQARGSLAGVGNMVLRQTLIEQETAFLSLLHEIVATARL